VVVSVRDRPTANLLEFPAIGSATLDGLLSNPGQPQGLGAALEAAYPRLRWFFSRAGFPTKVRLRLAQLLRTPMASSLAPRQPR